MSAWEMDFANLDDVGIWAWLDSAPDPAAVTPGAVLALTDGEDATLAQVIDLSPRDKGTVVHLQLLRRIYVDFMRVGLATRFKTSTWAEERAHLTVGQLVCVFGDDVDDAAARIVSVTQGTRDVELELLR